MNNQYSTSCKNCCFATWDNITQTGCAHNLLDKFRDNDDAILECYDEDKEFYVIQNRVCMFKRTEEWLGRQKSSDMDVLLEEQIKALTPVHSVIIFAQNRHILQKQLNALKNQQISELYVINMPSSSIKDRDINDMLANTISYKWYLNKIIQNTSADHIIHQILKNSKAHYCTVITNDVPKKKYIKHINNFLLRKLKIFGLIQDRSIYTVSRSVFEYTYYLGDKTISVVKFLQNNNNKVYQYGEI